ncbi:MAG: patatin family protein [Coriobacteriales bacterium]|nr:patatin family protein [Coriobacteriales bacterium]
MALPIVHPIRRQKAEAFVVPEVAVPLNDPRYKPAYLGAQLVDCNLVLEGGAMRGQFTAGVLDYFMDKALLPKVAIGVSAGALNGFNYIAGARGRTCYLNTKYCTDWRYLSMRSFAATGNAFNVTFTFDTIPNKLDPFDFDAYAASPLQLITVSSDLELGEADYHHLRDARAEMDYLRASSAMPLVSKITEIDGKKLLDGGICDSIPIEHSLQTGATKHIVVLTREAAYTKSPNKVMPLARRVYAEYPYFIERMEQRHFEYNRCYRRLARLHDAGDILIIRPPAPVTVASMERDPEKLYDLYLVGYKEAQKAWPAVLEYLER